MSILSDKELLKNNAHIPTEQVRQDIADTKCEIDQLSRHNELRRAGKFNRDDRIRDMKVKAVETQIAERKEFIADLERLLNLREAV